MSKDINPALDGVKHINVYSKGRTALGRWLSNVTHAQFTHPVHGTFNSVEGFWYYIATGFKHQQLREMWGIQAKRFGQSLKKVFISKESFEGLIKEAIRLKILNDPEGLEAFKKSTLPFEHYYVYGGRVVTVPQHDWQIAYLETLRASL